MEPWPLVAWFLMLTSLADWLKTVPARDFTKKDIIFLHPSSCHAAMTLCGRVVELHKQVDDQKAPPAQSWRIRLQFQSVQESIKRGTLKATPFPGGFKCFTCEEAADNYECNRWAPDVYCPQETKYCYTHHRLDWAGNTVSVTKRCVVLQDCLTTGCTGMDHEGIRVCVSCCEGNICNMPLPRNETDAIFATTSPLNGSHSTALDLTPLLFFILVLLLGHG